MKRRAFIGLLGASALSMPFILNVPGLGTAPRNHQFATTVKKAPLRLKLPEGAEAIIAQLGAKSKGVKLLGGGVIAAAGGHEVPYFNLLIDTAKFPAVKQSLFEFGVEPISTPGLPSTFARFLYRDKSYNVVNMKFDTYTRLSVTSQDAGLILFAHNFLIYDAQAGFVLDPYDALKAKTADGQAFLIKPIRQPKTLVNGFEHFLAATFDGALLGLQPSPEYLQLEDRVFQATPTPEDSKEIMARIIDYAPDILEVSGSETLSRMLTSPVCVAAAKTEAEIDLLKVDAKFRRLQKKDADISAREFMRIVDEELKKKGRGKGSVGGLPEYLATGRNQFRRMGVLQEVYETAAPA